MLLFCRLPEHVSVSGNQMIREQQKLIAKLGRVPSEEELRTALGWSAKKASTVRVVVVCCVFVSVCYQALLASNCA